MNQTALLLVFGFCISEALYNITIKKECVQNPEFLTRIPFFVALASGIATVLLFVTAFFTGGAQTTINWWKPVIISGFIVAGILYSEVKALSLEDASLVVPVSSATPASVIIASRIILGEQINWTGWAGIELVVVGTYILNIQSYLGKKRNAKIPIIWTDWLAPILRVTKSRGMRYAYLCVLLGTFGLNFEALAVRKANVAFASGCIFGIGALLNLLCTNPIKIIRVNGIGKLFNKNLLIVAGCIFAGVILVNSAFRYEVVPYVGAVKRFQIPLTVILAYFLLGEKENFRQRILGSSIMTAGLVLIAFS